AALMALVALVLKRRPETEGPVAVAVATSTLQKNPLEDENRRLQARVEELEDSVKTLTKAPKAEKKAAAETAPEKASGDYKALFEKLSELGLAAYGSGSFKDALDAVKSAGKPALEYLADILKTSKSATERFLAAALLEGAADPSSVDALAFAL